MAVLNQADFVAKWAGMFADNTTGEITEAFMREFSTDIADSFGNNKNFLFPVRFTAVDDTRDFALTKASIITAVNEVIPPGGDDIATIAYKLNGAVITPSFPYALAANNELTISVTFQSGKSKGGIEIEGTLV